jgi:large subunit ribosomal protein L15
MKLSDLKPSAGSTHREKRVGRGIGSGNGKTAGRGHKGRGSRAGGNTPPSYEGGQMPLQRRIPKRGFRRLLRNRARRDEFVLVNVGSLALFNEGETADPALMAARGLGRSGRKIKVLGDGELKHRITVRAHAFSKGAREKITAVGGTVELIEVAQKPDA